MAQISGPQDAFTMTLDGIRDAGYVNIATDPAGDLANPGPANWTGVAWTDATALYVSADASYLYVYVSLPNYDSTPSDGQGPDGGFGLVLDVDGLAGSGGGSFWEDGLFYPLARLCRCLSRESRAKQETTLPFPRPPLGFSQHEQFYAYHDFLGASCRGGSLGRLRRTGEKTGPRYG